MKNKPGQVIGLDSADKAETDMKVNGVGQKLLWVRPHNEMTTVCVPTQAPLDWFALFC